MKTSFVCAALLLLGMSSMAQADKPKADTTKKKEFVGGHVVIMKGRTAAPSSSGGGEVQFDSADAAQPAATSDLQIGTCRSCSGACSQCSPPKCACPNVSTSKTTGGSEASVSGTVVGKTAPVKSGGGVVADPANAITCEGPSFQQNGKTCCTTTGGGLACKIDGVWTETK